MFALKEKVHYLVFSFGVRTKTEKHSLITAVNYLINVL